MINIFRLLKPRPKYFIISKQIYNLRHQYMILHMNNLNIKMTKYKDPTITCLLYYGNLKNDEGKYKKYFKVYVK